jgi:hypothetical protein
MTEINTNNNSIPVVQARDLSLDSKGLSSKAIAQTSDATANGAAVNIAAKIASVSNGEIPQETQNLLIIANENPNKTGIQKFLSATGLKNVDIARMAAKDALNPQAA